MVLVLCYEYLLIIIIEWFYLQFCCHTAHRVISGKMSKCTPGWLLNTCMWTKPHETPHFASTWPRIRCVLCVFNRPSPPPTYLGRGVIEHLLPSGIQRVLPISHQALLCYIDHLPGSCVHGDSSLITQSRLLGLLLCLRRENHQSQHTTEK